MKDNTFGWNRRLFVGGAASVITSFYLAAVARGVLNACNNENVEAVLSSDDLKALIRIGNSYLNEHTENGELDILDEAPLDETEMRFADTVRHRLLATNRQVRDEFARCETVICDGWVLAKSEARLCAMIAARARRLKAG